MTDRDMLIELWARCGSPQEFELKASAVCGMGWRIRTAFRLYSFMRRRPAAVRAAFPLVVSASTFFTAVLASTLAAAGRVGLAVCVVAIFLACVVAASVAGARFDEFCTSVMEEEEAGE